MVDLFGTADKLVLNVAIVLGALVLAAGLGPGSRGARLDAGRLRVFAALGLFASLRRPLLDPLFARCWRW